ncbi:MAG: HAD-IB family phosphatase [Deinococcales bacterium]
MAVAADLEGTLTTGQTWRALGAYLVAQGRGGAYRRTFARNLPAALLARSGWTSMEAFRERWLHELLGLFAGQAIDAFTAAASWAVDHVLWPERRPEVVAALRVHQAAGERLVLASGAFQPVVEAFARRLQVETGSADLTAIGTPLTVTNGRLAGGFDGPLNVGDAKARRLHEALGSERLYAAYGDSGDDVPMLLLSDRPVAVYPDGTLRRTASDLGWSVFEP